MEPASPTDALTRSRDRIAQVMGRSPLVSALGGLPPLAMPPAALRTRRDAPIGSAASLQPAA